MLGRLGGLIVVLAALGGCTTPRTLPTSWEQLRPLPATQPVSEALLQPSYPVAEVAAGYSYFWPMGSGWRFSAAVSLTRWLALVADVGGNYLLDPYGGRPKTAYPYLFGVRFRYVARLMPFVDVLLGGARFDFHDETFGDQPFTWPTGAIGVGLDLPLTNWLALRLAHVEYVTPVFFRVSLGLVVRFGGRGQPTIGGLLSGEDQRWQP